MILANLNIVKLLFVPAIIFFLASCSQQEQAKNTTQQTTSWYRQAIVDLGNRISMRTPTEGIAISRGRGAEVNGKAYIFSNGVWTSFLGYPYSDYPLIAQTDSSIWTVHHLTHQGAYRPLMLRYQDGDFQEIPLPKIMWDATDYVMMKGFHVFKDETAWLVGQQGHILFFNGKKWKEVPSPLLDTNRSTAFDGDLNDVTMTSPSSGWAVGRNGILLRYENSAWEKIQSPTEQSLQKISMVNDSYGWAVGDNGTILHYTSGVWKKIEYNFREQFFSVFALDSSHAWIVGNNSTLLAFNGERWQQDNSLKIYDDVFSDISVVRDSSGTLHAWIIGNQGIYTNSQSLGFSFTDITHESALRRTGKIGYFFERSHKNFPDLLVLNEGGSSLLYENNRKNFFSDVTAETDLLSSPRDALALAIGDVNNDGKVDILQITDEKNFKMYFGTSSGVLQDETEFSQLTFDEINPLTQIAAKFIDLNNDGNLDLYVSNYDLPDQIFQNDGTGRFTNISQEVNIPKIVNHASYGAVFSDLNNDGLIDIFMPYYVSFNNKFFDLFINKGKFHFKQQDDPAFYSPTDLSPTAAVAQDFNNDGLTDIFIHSQKTAPILFVQTPSHHFVKRSHNVGLKYVNVHPEPINGIVACADVNNDGWMDIFDGSKLYLNSPQFYFREVSERVGIQFIGTPTFADIDNDGDMDIFIGSKLSSLGKGDRAALFRNNLNQSNFIKVRLQGDLSNRMALGAKVIVVDEKSNIQSKTVGFGANQVGAQNLNELHFGISGSSFCTVKVIFPKNARDTIFYSRVSAGTILEVSESNYLLHTFLLSVASIGRTFRILHWSQGILLFVLSVLLIFLFRSAGKVFHAAKFSHNSIVLILFGVLFLLFFQLSFFLHVVSAMSIAFGLSVVVGIVSLVLAGNILQKREAQYISHFKILALLGQGGMGKVYKAIDNASKNIVAIKILNQELLKDSENRKRLAAEAHLLSSFHHPNIVKVFEIGESSERGFIAMEYLSGGTLKEKLEKEHPLPFENILRYVFAICDGLEEVHRNAIVHRDVKTGNIMLAEDGSIRIMDFGLSKSPLVTTMTSLGTVLGTLGYVAPEQVTSIDVDLRTDIFSFGVVLYELLTNQLPFKGENEIALIHSIFNTTPPHPSTLRSDIPKEIDDIVMKCIAKNVQERYQSMSEVREALRTLITNEK